MKKLILTTAIILFSASAVAAPVKFKLVNAENEFIEPSCEWIITDEEENQVIKGYGRQMHQQLDDGAYIINVDCDNLKGSKGIRVKDDTPISGVIKVYTVK